MAARCADFAWPPVDPVALVRPGGVARAVGRSLAYLARFPDGYAAFSKDA